MDDVSAASNHSTHPGTAKGVKAFIFVINALDISTEVAEDNSYMDDPQADWPGGPISMRDTLQFADVVGPLAWYCRL